MSPSRETHQGYPVSGEAYVTDIHCSQAIPGTRANFDGREHVLVGSVWHPRMTVREALQERLRLLAELQQALAVASTLYHALDDASGVVDPGEGERYAYEAELESGAGLLGITRN